MFGETHRHFVLFKARSGSENFRYKQIVVIEREQFEVRVFETDRIELNPSFADGGLHHETYSDVASAVLGAEKQYKMSVRTGWRAVQANMQSFRMLAAQRTVA
jgi:hypothetical protein